MLAGIANTIAAISTPQGIGGIAVLRISGPRSIEIAERLTKKSRKDIKTRYALFSPLYSSLDQEIDHGIVIYYKSPDSYTGEDVVEISCHGGIVISNVLLETCIDLGCDLAEPGEFTKRAFLNGKIDLTQAESVAGIISSISRLGEEINYKNLRGKLSNRLNSIKERLLHLIAIIELELDFSEEEIEPTPIEEIKSQLDSLIDISQRLINSYHTGRILTDGAIVTIIGDTNVGKSSILNTIISEKRVIVSEEPGTTRDAIEVYYQINGIPLRLFDTAGIRLPKDTVEKSSIAISKEFIDRSDLIIWVFNATDKISYIFDKIDSRDFNSPFILVINKIDLVNINEIFKDVNFNGLNPTFVSTKTGKNIRLIVSKIFNHLSVSEKTISNEVFVTNARQKDAIENCVKSLKLAHKSIIEEKEGDLIALDLREALSQIDRILGITTADEIINNVFSNFCVGK